MNKRQRKKNDPNRAGWRSLPNPPLGPYRDGVRYYWVRMLKNGVWHRQRRVTIQNHGRHEGYFVTFGGKLIGSTPWFTVLP